MLKVGVSRAFPTGPDVAAVFADRGENHDPESDKEAGLTREARLENPATSHAVREYLAVLDDAAFGGATPAPPKQLAVTDPAPRWTAASRERAFLSTAL
jgi:hypothetical protein